MCIRDRFEGASKRSGIPASLSELPAEWIESTPDRPAGYCAQTLLRFGGLEIVTMLDSGATCSVMPEEVALTILAAAESKGLDWENGDHPVRHIWRIQESSSIEGINSGAPLEIKFALTLKAEFRAPGEQRGVFKEIYFKVFPKGTCSLPGIILGYPALDSAPYGLGWQVQSTVHTFHALCVSLPRIELARRIRYRNALERHRESLNLSLIHISEPTRPY